MGKKPIVTVTYENERISMKHSLPYLKCVLRLSCVVHGPNMAVLRVCKYELADAHMMTYYDKFSLLYLNVDKALKNSTPYCSF